MSAQYVRDLWLLAYGCRDKVAHVDRVGFLERVGAGLRVTQIEMLAAEVDRAFEYLSRNVNVSLLLTDLWRCLRLCGGQDGVLTSSGSAAP
ncbi:MAG: hypothetical protein ABH877_00425 [bacterium]